MNFDLLGKIVKRTEELGADDVVASGDKSKSWEVKFVDNKIVTWMSSYEEEVSLFISKDKRIGVTTIKDLSEKSIEESIAKLLRFTKKMQPNPEYNGIAQGPFRYKPLEGAYDGRVAKLGERAADFVVTRTPFTLGGAGSTKLRAEMKRNSRAVLHTSRLIGAEEIAASRRTAAPAVGRQGAHGRTPPTHGGAARC